MLKNLNVDFKEFMEVIDKCEGGVYVITEDHDKINLKSKLSQLIGIASLIADGRVKIETIIFDKQEDEGRMFRFLIYGKT